VDDFTTRQLDGSEHYSAWRLAACGFRQAVCIWLSPGGSRAMPGDNAGVEACVT